MRQRSPGVWDIQVSAGRDVATGTRRRVSRRIKGSETDAQRALTALQYEVDTGTYGGSLATVATVLERWWDIYGDNLAVTTAARYRDIVDRYLMPRWGAVRIDQLDPSEMSAWFARLARDGAGLSLGGRGLAPTTVRQIRAVFRRAMSMAEKWGWLPTNPVRLSDGVPVRTHRIEGAAVEVVRQLIDAADDELASWAAVAATTGMRRSEMAALRWDDVDLDAGHLTVRSALVQVGRALVEKDTKTHQVRELGLDAHTLDLFRQMHAAGPGVGFVWTRSADGSVPVVPDAISQAWRRLCRAQGVTGVRLHDLRHFMATSSLDAGQSLPAVAQRLGHGQVSTTLNIYADKSRAADRTVADHMGSVLYGD